MILFHINLGRPGLQMTLSLKPQTELAPLQSLPCIRNMALLSTEFHCSSQNQGGVMTFPLFLPSHFSRHQQALLERVLCFQHQHPSQATVTPPWAAGLLFHPWTILHLAARLHLSMINLTLLKPFSWPLIPFGMKFIFLPMVLNALCHLPPAFLLDPSLTLLCSSIPSRPSAFCLFLAKSARPQSFCIHFSVGVEGPFPKSLQSWFLLGISLAPCKQDVRETSTGHSSWGLCPCLCDSISNDCVFFLFFFFF